MWLLEQEGTQGLSRAGVHESVLTSRYATSLQVLQGDLTRWHLAQLCEMSHVDGACCATRKPGELGRNQSKV